MKILSVDTSCDESCVAIIDTEKWKLLSDVVHSHVDKMQSYGGIVPEIASREHLKALPLAYLEALKQANLSLEEIDWFTVTNRPGLIGALLVGVSFVKALAYSKNKPFSVVNHIEGHLYSPLLATLEGKEVPSFPWIALVVSGGHSELFQVNEIGDYQWLGGTLDDAAGEAFDKIGKLLGMNYPAGPSIDKLVREKASDADRKHYSFPKAKTTGYHFSFSGLKTSVMQKSHKEKLITEDIKIKLLASSQEAIVDALIEKVEFAKKELGISQVVVSGGVACNSRLRQKLSNAYFPSPKHCSDNAAMIALLSALKEKAGLLQLAPLTETAYASCGF